MSTKSIMIGTLFHSLQEALACGGFNADPTLARIIKQDSDIAGTISVATTHVPDFGEQISNPSHGFRSLCCLCTVTPHLQDIPQNFHPSYELLASKTRTDNPVAICFAESFQPMGIDLVSHFNIIFYPIHASSIPSLWSRGASTSTESSLSPWDSISAVQSPPRNTPEYLPAPSPQPQAQPEPELRIQPLGSLPPHENSSCVIAPPHGDLSESSSSLYGFATVAIPLAPSHSPAYSPQLQPLAPSSVLSSPLSLLSPHLLSLSSTASTLPSPLPLPPQSLSPPPPITSHCPVPNESSTPKVQSSEPESESILLVSSSSSTIPLLLKTYIITEEQKEAATYKRAFRGLYLKVRNFNAMNLILNIMGYSLPFRVAADSTPKLSNITVKASEVLQYFGWAPTSFEHKTLWFGTAKTLSQRNWKRGVPGK